jgi:hypothetical protein
MKFKRLPPPPIKPNKSSYINGARRSQQTFTNNHSLSSDYRNSSLHNLNHRDSLRQLQDLGE